MDRVLMLRLEARGCEVEVRLNDFPLGRAGALNGVLYLPVHEYVLAGTNAISIEIDPPEADLPRRVPVPKVADGDASASVRLILPRVGQIGKESQSRSLAELDWSVADGEVFKTPLVVSTEVALPIKFPRWRWLDAPEVDNLQALKPAILSHVQGLALALAKGEVDSFLEASRLRVEELALAYQQPVADMKARLRARLQLLYATKAMKMIIPGIEDLRLRTCANRRLIECLGPGGEPVLRTAPAPDGSRVSWPVRLAVVNGQCIILR
jgi:hypothetical protein